MDHPPFAQRNMSNSLKTCSVLHVPHHTDLFFILLLTIRLYMFEEINILQQNI